MYSEIETKTDSDRIEEKVSDEKKGLSPLVRTLLFFLILCLVGFYLLNVFDMKDDKGAEKVFRTFYSERDNSLDGIYIGSSSAYRFWIPPYAYEQNGMAISNLGTGSQPVVLQKYIIMEALKTQPEMKVVIIDIRSMLNEDKRLKEADIRRITDSFHIFEWFPRPSRNRINAIDASLAYFQDQEADIEYNKLYYYLPFLKYHNRWQSDIEFRDLTGVQFKNRFKGFVFTSSGSMRVKELEPPVYTDAVAETIEPTKRDVLRDLIRFCKTLDQEVIFVSAPYRIPEAEQEQLNACTELIMESGFTILNFNQEQDVAWMGLDWNTHFMDPKHVNIYGAMKYTTYLANYLSEHIELPDHRGDAAYQSWEQSQERFHKKLERLEGLRQETEEPVEG